MAGKLKHEHRIRAAEEYGRKYKQQHFHIKTLVEWCNNYKSQRGKVHRFTQTNNQQMGNILKMHKDFVYVKPSTWKYVGE